MVDLMALHFKVVLGGWLVGVAFLGFILVCCGVGKAAEAYSKRSKK